MSKRREIKSQRKITIKIMRLRRKKKINKEKLIAINVERRDISQTNALLMKIPEEIKYLC